MARRFEAAVRRAAGFNILDLHGEIDDAAEGALGAAYAEAESGNSEAILLNFGDVEYMNSTGIALIVGLLARARTSRRRLAVYGLSDHYDRIFQITRLADFVSIFPDEGTALASLAETATSPGGA